MRSWEAIRVRRADVEDRWSGRIGREHLQHAAGERQSASSVPWRGWRLVPKFQVRWWGVGASFGL